MNADSCRDIGEGDDVRSEADASASPVPIPASDELPSLSRPDTYEVRWEGWADARWLCTVGLGCVCGEGCDE